MSKELEFIKHEYEHYKNNVGWYDDGHKISQYDVDQYEAVLKVLTAFDSIRDLIELIDDEHGYGITLKGLYTFKFISKETYDLLKEVLL